MTFKQLILNMFKTKSKWFIVLAMLSLSTTLIGNKYNVTILESQNPDSICNWFNNLDYYDGDKLLRYANILLNEKHLSNTKYFAFGNLILGERAYYQNDFKQALTYYSEAIRHFKNLNDTFNTAQTLKSVGVANYILCNDDKAYEAYLEAFDLYSNINNPKGVAEIYHNLALIHWRSGNFEKTDYYSLKAIEKYKEIGEYEQLADMYNNYGVSLVKRTDYEKGLTYYKKAIPIYKKTKNKRGETIVIYNIGNLFEYKQQHDSAYSYYNKAHNSFLTLKDTLSLINSFQKLARYSIKEGTLITALEMLLTAEKLNQKIGDKESEANINYDLSEVYEKLNKYQESLSRYKRYILYSDSVKDTESSSRIAEIESKFLVKQTQDDLKLSQQESDIKTYAIIIIVLLISVIGLILFFYWHRYKKNEEQRVLMLEHKVLRTQMDPHFIFNSLSALQCYIMDDKPEDAISFLSDFSALLRLVLQYSKSEMVLISKEKMILDYYLALQNRRFDNKINFAIEIDEELLTDEVLIPPMLAQPFIENSLEHGGLEKFENAKILVSFTKVNRYIKLVVEDNGIGIEKALREVKNSTNHKSLAISITNERLKLINSKQKEKVDLIITDLSRVGLRGTRVEFMIPIKNS